MPAPPPSPALVSLHTIGEARIVVTHVTGSSTTLTPTSARLFTLALLLAAAPGRPTSRAQLTAWLWPTLAPTAARPALRQLLYRLRQLGVPVDGDDHLVLDPQRVAPPDAFPPSSATCTLLRSGRCLPNWNPPGTALRLWLDGYRATVESRVRTALVHALEHSREHSRETHPDHAALTAALRDLDPHHPLARAPNPRPPAVREPPPARRPPCIGRDPVLRTLLTHVAAARQGLGAAVVLAAPPRAGATRLLEELAHTARTLGVTAVHRPNEPPPTTTVTHHLATTVRQLLDRPGALGCGPHALRTLRQFAVTRALPTGDALVRRLGAAIAELARAVGAERPLLVVVDVPCATPLERALASAVARAITDAAALAVFVAHPNAASAFRGVAHVVALDPLDATAAGELATATALERGRTLTPADRGWCTTVARGRPGDVIALASACATRPGTRQLPPTVAARLHAQIVTLPSRTRQVAALCALIGDVDTADRAAHALQRRPAAIQAALYELRRADLPGITLADEGHDVEPDVARIVGTAALATFDPAERAVLRDRAAAARATTRETVGR